MEVGAGDGGRDGVLLGFFFFFFVGEKASLGRRGGRRRVERERATFLEHKRRLRKTKETNHLIVVGLVTIFVVLSGVGEGVLGKDWFATERTHLVGKRRGPKGEVRNLGTNTNKT